MKEIQLTRGYVALVDDADYARVLVAGPWYAQLGPRTVYARRSVLKPNGDRTKQSLHRFLLGLTDPAVAVDHADCNGLNNQRANLRIGSRSQNGANRAKLRGRYSSAFKGVSWHEKTRKWQAYITVCGKRSYLGLFRTEAEASAAYRAAALKQFGQFMRACKKSVTEHKF
jgi:AP2 domain